MLISKVKNAILELLFVTKPVVQICNKVTWPYQNKHKIDIKLTPPFFGFAITLWLSVSDDKLPPTSDFELGSKKVPLTETTDWESYSQNFIIMRYQINT